MKQARHLARTVLVSKSQGKKINWQTQP